MRAPTLSICLLSLAASGAAGIVLGAGPASAGGPLPTVTTSVGPNYQQLGEARVRDFTNKNQNVQDYLGISNVGVQANRLQTGFNGFQPFAVGANVTGTVTASPGSNCQSQGWGTQNDVTDTYSSTADTWVQRVVNDVTGATCTLTETGFSASLGASGTSNVSGSAATALLSGANVLQIQTANNTDLPTAAFNVTDVTLDGNALDPGNTGIFSPNPSGGATDVFLTNYDFAAGFTLSYHLTLDLSQAPAGASFGNQEGTKVDVAFGTDPDQTPTPAGGPGGIVLTSAGAMVLLVGFTAVAARRRARRRATIGS